ncbi:MAG: class I adenylate cyclase [Spirochaetes bacterium]|nr:class I adenylate cyclase [Spirochaetota bacterium]
MEESKREALIRQINTLKSRFERYNADRLGRLYASFANPHHIELFEALPFIISNNHPSLPGYIQSNEIVKGIYGYTPTGKGLAFIRSRFPQAPISAEQPKEPFIQMFALMGSGGTIAFTEQSDLDFWVCADEQKYSEEAIANFRKKCHLIEEWIAEHFNLEVHFFLNDISKVKQNIFDEDEDEAFTGSALGILLKEEFFRSSIIVAGKIPFWWVVPANTPDSAYQKWLELAKSAGLFDSFVDLGNLHSVPKEEFLGSAIFQILKSLGNPYKSIIKLGLLERYLRGSAENPFISNLIKKNVHEGKFDISSVDSYIIMFNEVYNYYHNVIKDPKATEILKTSFYLKVDPKLSRYEKKGNDAPSEKIAVMREFIRKWGWLSTDLERMDNFENWDINAVNALLNNTKRFVLQGYRDIITNIESRKLAHRFTDEQIKGISRKIYSHFAISDNKIDNSLSFKMYPPEKLLLVEYSGTKGNKELWILSKRAIINNVPTKIVVHSERSLVAIIAWIGMNRLFLKDYTRIDFAAGIYQPDANFLRDLLSDITAHFSFKKLNIHSSYFLRDPFPLISYIIINLHTKYAKRIEEIIFLYHNSWGETRYERYANFNDIAPLFARVLTGTLSSNMPYESALRLTSSYPYRASKEFDWLQSLSKDLYNFFHTHSHSVRLRYVTMMQNTYFVFSSKKFGNSIEITCRPFDSEVKLLYSLSYNTGVENKIKVDPLIPELNYLRLITDKAQSDVVQIFFQSESKYCYFFVVDERGGFVFFRKPAELLYDYLTRLYLFAESAVKNAIANNQSSPLATSKKPVIIYQLKRELSNECTITEINPELHPKIIEGKKKIVPTVLSLAMFDNGEIAYRFTLPDGGLSSELSKNDLPAIAREIKALQDSYPGYSVIPTEIRVDNLEIQLYRNFTSLAFAEKNRFELLIEQGMK